EDGWARADAEVGPVEGTTEGRTGLARPERESRSVDRRPLVRLREDRRLRRSRILRRRERPLQRDKNDSLARRQRDPLRDTGIATLRNHGLLLLREDDATPFCSTREDERAPVDLDRRPLPAQ